MKTHNIIGPKIRRLRHIKGWSQNDLATKLQILGMMDATRGKVSKIEARIIWVSDIDIYFLSCALAVAIEELYPSVLHDSANLHEVVQLLKQSRYGVS
ncbi:MAG: helix-turn-helix domain-containing protein [Chthoniobacterales bacterium]|nr:helix-turn-helix transcriptional regulator [Verrucomicrobiota bacterium]